MSVTVEQVNQLYQELLGRSGQEEYLQNWAQTGGTLEEIRAGIAGSPEGRQAAPLTPVMSDDGVYTEQQMTPVANSYLSQFIDPPQQTPPPGVSRQQAPVQSRISNPISGQQAPITPVTTEQVSALYQKYLGRPGQDRFLQDWAKNGGTLKQIRAGIAGSPEAQAYAAAQAAGGTPAGGTPAGGTPAGGTPAGGIPDWFSGYMDQFSAMEAEIAALNALLTEQQAGGNSSSVTQIGTPGGVSVGQPGGGTTTTSSGSSYTMPTVAPPMDNPYLAQLPTSPPVGYVPPTPEMLDAYRYEQFYNQGMIPPVDQGIGGLSYFGIPPSQIQTALTGF